MDSMVLYTVTQCFLHKQQRINLRDAKTCRTALNHYQSEEEEEVHTGDT